jgi:hypothetical protein
MFRFQGPGWQTRINAVLKAYKEAAASRSGGLTSRSSGRLDGWPLSAAVRRTTRITRRSPRPAKEVSWTRTSKR